MNIYVLLLLCLSLVRARPGPEPQIQVEEIETVDDPEVTEGYFQGDIELPTLRNAISFPSRKWPGGIVYYYISTLYSDATRAIILEAMREIESNTKHGFKYCVRFVERTTQPDYIYIKKHTGSAPQRIIQDSHIHQVQLTCHSLIGRVGGPQMVSIGSGCERKGTIMHELNHALGFWHEQNRYDRDNYITVHTDNIPSSHLSDFEPQSSSDMNLLGTAYDFGSIMHYGPYTYAVDRSKPSISPKPGLATGVTMGQRLAMSTQDVIRIQKLYQCTVGSIVECNFEHDLCGLTQDTQGDFDWTRKAGSTSTPHTGPTADHSNSVGYYIYAQANGHHRQTARLLSKTVSGGNYCLDFWLFQYGSQEGSFQIRAAGTTLTEKALKTVSGSQVNAWKHFKLNLVVPAPFHVILQANIGNGDWSDIAVDDFFFYTGHCL